jgi:hypothetical protein
MGSLIQAGSLLVATTAPAGLNQYYGYADATQTIVTATSLTALSSTYTIPAGEATAAGVAYELLCGGTMSWGTASEHLELAGYFNGASIHTTITIDDSVFGSGSTQEWDARFVMVCSDGVSQWLGSWRFSANQSANHIIPGTAADNTVTAGDSATSAITASTGSAITMALRACWSGSSGSPAIYNDWTVFRKIS